MAGSWAGSQVSVRVRRCGDLEINKLEGGRGLEDERKEGKILTLY